MRVCSLVCAFALLGFAAVSSATVIPAGNVSGLWKAAGNPYRIQGDVQVPAGAILSIGPGVHVVFEGAYALTVRGRLFALGAEHDSIVFTAPDTVTRGLWHGIRLERAEDTVQLRYCVIERAQNASGGVDVIQSKVAFGHCALRGNFYNPDDNLLGEFAAFIVADAAASEPAPAIEANDQDALDAPAADSDPDSRVKSIPADFVLLPCYPNPFNSSTVFSWVAPAPARIRLMLFNELGEQMAVVSSGSCAAGVTSVRYDANRLPAGVYIARLEANGRIVAAQKLLLLK